MRVLFSIALLLVVFSVQAASKPLYRFVDENGVVHYTDKAPNQHAKPMQRDLRGNLSAVAPERFDVALPPSPRFAVHFDTPTPGQVFADDKASVPVAMSVMPGLIKGFSLTLRVDGYTAETRLRELHTALHGLGAGSHVIMAVLVNARGQELAHSSPLTIQIRPAEKK